MRWWRKTSVGLKVAIIATVVLALSIVGVLAAERFDSSNQGDAVKTRESDTGTSSKPEPDAKLASNPLELGTVAKVSSNYRVAVTAVSQYAAPTGPLVAATVKATYVGTEDGEPWADLNVEFAKSGSPAFGESDCPAGLGSTESSDESVLATGDEETYDVCFDLSTNDIEGAQVSVEEAFAAGERVFWSTEGAVTKALPSAPKPPVTPTPAAGPQPAQKPDPKAVCKDFDDEEYEEAKEAGDEMKERFEAYKDAGGDDEDEIEDFEEWEEAHDEQMDQLEKLDDLC